MTADKDSITIRGVAQAKEECIVMDDEASDNDINASSICIEEGQWVVLRSLSSSTVSCGAKDVALRSEVVFRLGHT
jgi:hypothetical protein